jgi:hypothetical protein
VTGHAGVIDRGGSGVTTTVLQAYRFALDLAPAQEAALRSHCGGQRYALNWGWRW